MRTISLGRSEISVPVVGLGTMGIGGYFDPDQGHDQEFTARLRQGIDLGATLVDTAEIYGAGHAEELVGAAVKACREKVVVATKFSPEHSQSADVLKAAEGSLRRLKMEVIDLYQTHWPNPSVPFEETIGALRRLLDAGKVRTVGLSNASVRQWKQAQAAFGPHEIVSFQQQYNLADRFVETTLLPVCQQEGLVLIAYSPLLEGKIAPDDPRRRQLETLAHGLNVTVGQVVLAWLLRHPTVVVIPKAANPIHLKENIAASALTLDGEAVRLIDELYAPRIMELVPGQIDVEDAAGRQVYKTLAEALENPARMSPSPRELAEEFVAGEPFRPIKVRRTPGDEGTYTLVEGRLRYWAWVIAHGNQRSIACTLV